MKKSLWVFGSVSHGTVLVSESYEIPAHFEDDNKTWVKAKKVPALHATFEKGTKLCMTDDKALADAIKAHPYFRTTENPDGRIWLVSEDEFEVKKGKPVIAPAPEPVPGVQTIKGARGTGITPVRSKKG